MTHPFKILLIGPTNVGKTTFLHRHLTGEFRTEHKPTLGVEIHSLKYNTNYGNICLNIWDCAGDPKFTGLKNNYYLEANGAIIMTDLTGENIINQLEPWLNDIKNMKIPIVVCGNKCDLIPYEEMYKLSIEIAKWLHSGNIQNGITYYDIS